jgi:hypothetical protein
VFVVFLILVASTLVCVICPIYVMCNYKLGVGQVVWASCAMEVVSAAMRNVLQCLGAALGVAKNGLVEVLERLDGVSYNQ